MAKFAVPSGSVQILWIVSIHACPTCSPNFPVPLSAEWALAKYLVSMFAHPKAPGPRQPFRVTGGKLINSRLIRFAALVCPEQRFVSCIVCNNDLDPTNHLR